MLDFGVWRDISHQKGLAGLNPQIYSPTEPLWINKPTYKIKMNTSALMK